MSKFVDLTGRKFGRLTVIKRVEDHIRVSGRKDVMWKCECLCGIVKDILGENLRNGHTISCGCYSKDITSKSNLKDLVGKRFGRLIVLKRGKDYISPSGKTKKVRWLCHCDCGANVLINANVLKNGDTKSCGCLRREVTSARVLNNLIGKRFGRLMVLERAVNHISPDGSSTPRWLCQCDCGKKIEVLGNSLYGGNTRSCGCLGEESRKRYVDLSGNRYGLLRVLNRVKNSVTPAGHNTIRYLCICDCGNLTEVNAPSLTKGLTISCGCSIVSKYEEKITMLLKNKNISFNREFSFKNCRDKRLLPFDFALMKNEVCVGLIEYDGRQHFQAIDYFGGKEALKITQKHDEIKNVYCKENNIPLLRIPHWDKGDIASLVADFIKGET